MAQETAPERQASPAPEGTYRSAELDWLEQHQDELAARYAGEWVAIDGSALVSHATTLEAVVRLARERGHPDPLITFLASRLTRSGAERYSSSLPRDEWAWLENGRRGCLSVVAGTSPGVPSQLKKSENLQYGFSFKIADREHPETG